MARTIKSNAPPDKMPKLMRSSRSLPLLFVACAAAQPPYEDRCAPPDLDALTPLDDLGDIIYEANNIYWTEHSGAVQHFSTRTKQSQTLSTRPGAPQQLCKQGEALFWYERSTSYETPNQLIRFDLNTYQSDAITIDYLAQSPTLICAPERVYFINRGRKLIEYSAEGLREILRTSGSPTQLQAAAPYLYVIQREVQALKYTHNTLLQLDPRTAAQKSILSDDASPLSFAIQGETLFASVYQSEAREYALVQRTPTQTTVLLRGAAPLSSLVASQSHLYFTQQDPSGYTIYRLDLESHQTQPWVAGLVTQPTHLALDEDFLYWVGLHKQAAWLLRVLQ